MEFESICGNQGRFGVTIVESQLPFASNGDYFGRKRLPGKIPEKLNKKRQLRRYDPTITA